MASEILSCRDLEGRESSLVSSSIRDGSFACVLDLAVQKKKSPRNRVDLDASNTFTERANGGLKVEQIPQVEG